MRARISTRKRKMIILISLILFVIAIVAIIFKVNSLTRGVLNNDRIAINVKCAKASVLTPEDIDKIKESGKYGDISFLEDVLNSMKSQNDEICVLEFEFLVNNMEESKITDLAMNIVPDDKAMGKVYGCSSMELVDQKDGVMTLNQTVVLDRVDVYNNYFSDELPVDFDGPFKYEFSYAMEGQYGRKTMTFAATKKE